MIMGPNGAGKSTVLCALLLLVRAARGPDAPARAAAG